MKKTKKTLIALVAASLIALAFPGSARADNPLKCSENDPDEQADGAVAAAGTHEMWVLQQEVFIPHHEDLCPQTVGKVRFREAPDPVAIDGLAARDLYFIGLNQPLSAEDWVRAATVNTLPLMIDGFVVTANIPCSQATTNIPKFDPVSLAAIYSGAVTRWNDPVLLQRNPWLQSCGVPIKVGIRQDEAWSNHVFKDYLSKRAPQFAPLKERGRLDEWPGTLDPACGGSNEDHMASCALLSGSITYMRFATANAYGLRPAKLANGSDREPDPNAVTPTKLLADVNQYPPPNHAGDLYPSGCQDAVIVPRNLQDWQAMARSPQTSTIGPSLDWSSFSMTYNPQGYALCGMAVIVTQTGLGPEDQNVKQAWRDHLKLMWSDAMQEKLKDYGYAPLPEQLQANMLASSPLTASE